MADSSSDSDNFLTGRVGRRPLRASHNTAQNYGAEEVTEKIHTLASTLQDTNRNLRHVDHLLGQYREYNKEQTKAITTLKETLEQSIDQLRSQRLTRNSGMRSASLSSLYPSDLDVEGTSGNRHFLPTSPLRDYGDSQGNKHRRSRSASVRFVNETDNVDQLHSFHQSLRDLSSEQVRLGDDISRELSRRNRTDAELRKTLEELSEKLTESQRQETVSERVERRLQEIEEEMRAERQLVERRQDQLGHVSLQLQEVLRKQDAKADETEEFMRNKLVKYESEKHQLEQELEQSRKKLSESEGSREALLHQMEDLRSQLLRAEEDRVELQHQISYAAMHRQSYQDVQDDDRRIRGVTERYEREKQDLEKHILELKAKLSHNAVMSEVEELKRCIERKDKEKAQLVMHIQGLTSDLENREKQQEKMLDQLKEIQNCYKACENGRRQSELQSAELAQQVEESTKEAERYLTEFKHSEALRLEIEKKREDLKVRAQETIRQWKLKCKKLNREIEKQNQTISELMDKNSQALKDKDDLKSQLLSAINQIENLRKELDDVLTKRAQQEELLHCKEVKLNEMQSHQVSLEEEIKEVQGTVKKLENELKKQVFLQNQMQAEKEHLKTELATINSFHKKDQEQLLEMQADVKNLSAVRVELTNRIAEEEKAKKELLKSLSDLQKQQESNHEEMISANRQLKMEREIHQQELADLRSELQNVKIKHEQNVQELRKLLKQEKDDAEAQIRMLKMELLEEKNIIKNQCRQLEKIKVEYDKLTEELTQNEEENIKLKRKCEFLKQELEKKEKQISNEDHLRKMSEARLQFKDQLRHLEMEQQSILSMIGSEIDAACEIFSRESMEKFKAISLTPTVLNDPHRWLAEAKTKLQWLCEEVKERESKEKKLRCYLLQSREQLKHFTQIKETEHQSLFKQIKTQEKLLEEVHREKRELLEKTHRREEEMGALQERIMALEMSTRVALNHLESVPEKLSLLEDRKDTGESHFRMEMIEERYMKYKDIVSSLQQQLKDSKQRVRQVKDVKRDAEISDIEVAAHSSSWRTQNSFLCSSPLSSSGSLMKGMVPLDASATKEDSPNVAVSEMKLQAEGGRK
ncbi:centrosomal protein of 128 kDa isoform X1 [Parus major]|uniref:centrosomal protein of 128 kDa isoform X1 n=1 Tax=Parus major TaxID=9157 RepID=UPI0007716495|nr:centrosomal protein of 128 kDa isoform X1 [Parus major]XP_015487008.1 centrosomal protein of 128 kDa isoform X1 [Parus major]XP_015487009.1 centrosomal protein of 128 kDa isoform X1 [Parus major]XP_015487010.1 centrosomal protein of 128 kDa isoform X1 [Parus major]XP_015487012.1 centrosomal protein of 128 kDa isoform X1 [Parus major]XP_015487013.1 centrosomal protein of 128 kDa isoform X1 [Parus major]